MIYSDAHCHLHLPALASQFTQVIREHPNCYLAAAAAEQSDWPLLMSWSKQNPRRFAICLGLHPCQAEVVNMPDCLADLRELLGNARASAIGEIGLDYTLSVDRQKQLELLRVQLDLAVEFGLPVVLHVVRSHGIVLDLLSRYNCIRGIVHGFYGHPQVLLRYLKLGMNISLNSAQMLRSFGRATELKWREIVHELPLTNLMLESDCCLDRNGRPREIIDTEQIARIIAGYKRCMVDEVREIAADNMLKFYGLSTISHTD